ncbi:MAG: TonB-dependent receptor [Pseudomonadota bacterium]
MKLSIDGLFRKAAHAAFVSGLAAASFSVVAQDASGAVAIPPAETAPAATPAAAPAEAPPATVDTIAVAEPAPPAPAAASEKAVVSVELKKISVTGSRIKSPNLTSSSPITTVGAAEVKAQGTTRVEDLLNSLPQVFADQGGNLANGATGTATVDLRDLGSSRTLVLIDGKRVQPGDPGDSTADLNFIPAALIDRVDVLTGGASSTYGADAVAGVVNFIMKKDFQGVRVEAQRGIFNHKNDGPYDALLASRNFAIPSKNKWDGQSWDLSAVIGTNTGDGKGNITAYATYRQIDPIDQGQRDFSSCSLGASGANELACAGSSTNALGRFLGDNGNFTLDPTGPGNTFRSFVGARDAFNFNPFNYFQRNDERYTLGSFANYEFNEHAEAYAQVMFMDDRTNAVIAPSGAFFGNDIYTLSRDNPLISDQQEAALFTEGMDTVDALIGRRNVEGGPRDSDLRHTSYRILGGVKGNLIGEWDYDTSYQYGKTIRDNIYRGEFSRARTIRALDVVTGPDGTPTCQSVIDGSDPNCVPYNIFQVGGVTPAALNYLTLPGFANGVVQERVFSGFVSGPVGVQSPFAKENISLAIGVEYRDEEAINEFDSAFQSGDLAGQGGASLNAAGSFDVKEIYGEVKLPIWQDQPLGKELSIDLGYRYSDYSSISPTDAYKLGLNYAPTDDIKARFSYNRAVRAPNIGELSQPTNVQLDGSTDPCAGTANNENGTAEDGEATATRAQCANDPLIATNPGLYGTIDPSPASQYNGQVGTDPGLQAEKADTVTAGFVFTPTFLKGASASVDFYSIKVDGFISGYGADTILQACYERGQLCDLINRDPNSGPTFGSLWLGQNGFVIDTVQNTGRLKVEGVDFKADYRVKGAQIGLPDAGTFVIDYVGSLLLKQDVTPIPGDSSSTYKCKGKYGTQCGAPVTEYRHKLRNTWQLPWVDGSLSLAWRYFDGVKTDGVGLSNNRDAKLKPQSYFDLFGSIRFQKAYTLRVGVNNVLDNDPPIVNSGNISSVSGSGNTYPQVYDALGRFIFSSVTLDF